MILKSHFAVPMEAGCEAASIASQAENDDGGCRGSCDLSWAVRLDGEASGAVRRLKEHHMVLFRRNHFPAGDVGSSTPEEESRRDRAWYHYEMAKKYTARCPASLAPCRTWPAVALT